EKVRVPRSPDVKVYVQVLPTCVTFGSEIENKRSLLVKVTVPTYAVFVVLSAFWAVTFRLNGEPAIAVVFAETAKWACTPTRSLTTRLAIGEPRPVTRSKPGAAE